MNPLEIIGLVVVAVWLGVLTLTVLLLTRQLGVILARLQDVGVGVASMGQGVQIGERVPGEVKDLLAVKRSNLLLMITTRCDACSAVVEGLSGTDPGVAIVTLIPGDAETATMLSRSLHPAFTLVQDPEASMVAEQIRLNAAPYVMEIKDGVVTRKSFVQGPNHLLEFIGHEKERPKALLQIENGSVDAFTG